MFSNPSSCTSSTVKPNKLKHQSLEWRETYFKSHARRMRWRMLKRPEFPNEERVFIGKIWSTDTKCMIFFWMLGGEAMGDLPVISIINRTSLKPTPVFSLKLPSSTWVGTLVSVEELRDNVPDCYVHTPRRTQYPAPSLHCLFFCIPSLL